MQDNVISITNRGDSIDALQTQSSMYNVFMHIFLGWASFIIIIIIIVIILCLCVLIIMYIAKLNTGAGTFKKTAQKVKDKEKSKHFKVPRA